MVVIVPWNRSTIYKGVNLAEEIGYQDRDFQFHSVFDSLFFDKILYVGAHKRSRGISYLDYLKTKCNTITLLEIHKPNVEACRKYFTEAIKGDVRDVHTLPRHDCIVWIHGPEHLPQEDLPKTILRCEQSSDMVVMACPYGQSPQDDEYGNPHEVHQCHLSPKFFYKLGYTVLTVGLPDRPDLKSQILAVKVCQ